MWYVERVVRAAAATKLLQQKRWTLDGTTYIKPMRIHHPLLFGFLALSSCASDPAELPLAPAGTRQFRITSLGQAYPMTGAARGSYRIERDTLFVTVDQGQLRNNVAREFAEDGILQHLVVQAGIGAPTETGWRIESRGEEVNVAAALRPQQEVYFREVSFAVPLQSGVAPRDRWLYFALQGTHAGLYGYDPGPMASYMCGPENLLGPTEESRRRAEGMRRQYTTFC